MKKKEKLRRINKLDDAKLVRFNLGRIYYSIMISVCALSNFIFMGFGLIFLFSRHYQISIFFLICEWIFVILQWFLIFRQENEENKFLLKHGE